MAAMLIHGESSGPAGGHIATVMTHAGQSATVHMQDRECTCRTECHRAHAGQRVHMQDRVPP